ncbi:hypothetical protein CEP51_006406 [Fusarium floridanum]|uniref:Uncharacterized protein n=1 Tax=Fusarium floridanum TaxID=1325733 RepID=A0A428RSW8_9HYPO|nr:hypothetical protein CEP51_006406 [Fusarium floridanum]
MSPKISSSPTQDVALQPIPSSTSPPGQGQADSEMRHQPSLIGLSDAPWAIPDHRGSYDNGSIIHHTLDDDSDSDQDQPHATKKGGCAFDAVRNKLIRTMSHDSSTKNPSLTSLGNSEEEIARRAELRRLMRQRIQDELQTEQPDDMENKPTHGIRCIASIVNIGLPSAGPRDAIEFAVNKSPSLDARVPRSGKDQSHEIDASEPQNAPDGQKKTTLDRTSPTEENNKAEKDVDKGDGTGVATNLPSQIPRPGRIEQAHSQKSFQLSNSVTRLDRILGPDNSFNSRHASSSADGHSALGVWLIAQGLRSRDNSTLHFDDDEEDEIGNGIDNSQVVHQPGPAETKKEEPISDSQNIITKEETLPANEASAADGTLDKAGPSDGFDSERCRIYPHPETGSRRTGNTSSPRSGGRIGAPTVATTRNSIADNSSSCYPSKFQPSPARSRQNLYRLDLKELEGMEMSPFKWQAKSSQDQESSEKQQQNSTNDDEPQSKDIDVGEGCQGQTPTQAVPDTASRSQSECASFLQREAELGTIERRFGDLLARRKSKSQYISRFREEFNEPSLGQPVRKSFMSKIHLTVPIRFKWQQSLKHAHSGPATKRVIYPIIESD